MVEERLQPCEICGKTTPPDEDDKYDDIVTPARPGSQAWQDGHINERLCGRCACAQFIGSYWNGAPGRKHTLIERYILQPSNRAIFVKRDDLWDNGKYGGGNAKLRGIEVHLRALIDRGISHVAVLDSRTSRLGWGVAELCRDLGMKCTVFFGLLKAQGNIVPYFQQQAANAGAELISMPASRIYPMYYKARIQCQDRGIYLLPMGGQLSESIFSVAGEASTLPTKLLKGTIVCVVATGTMFAGMLMGLKKANDIIGVYIGMTSGEIDGRSKADPHAIVHKRIAGLLPAGFEPLRFRIVLGDREYYADDNYPCPFTCDKWYDRKAWRWLCEHIDDLKDPILYWNIG